MIKFVVARPVKKIQRSYTPIDSDKKKIKVWIHFFSIKLIRVAFILFALIYWWFLLLRSSLFNHQYTIKRVLYDSWNIAWYDEPYLYRRINTWIKGENYYVVKMYKSKVLDDIRLLYPMVSDITVEYRSSNTVFIQLTFVPIDMIVRNQDVRFALIGTTFLPIYSWNKIANGIRVLDLPSYLSGMNSLSGLFYRQPATWLVQQVEMIYQWFPGLTGIEYLPWWERSILYFEGKRFYINNLADIQNQIRNYQLLKKYYKEYKQLADIDLGSLEVNKVIVRKQN
ncbi:MAG: hypothetical protein ACD_80C00084G0012 [uncultured bacterium (gcode 4)]|uniref:POTRA domain-containing protein n=1 Tax=uncultured bacterium (gcode 4) TaxID=1234023 RepID=K1XJF9_9BACT|nr:MAG: hypothetical protein ACD_80C00084G0012 [uncultured bacterium (gcode 4)]